MCAGAYVGGVVGAVGVCVDVFAVAVAVALAAFLHLRASPCPSTSLPLPIYEPAFAHQRANPCSSTYGGEHGSTCLRLLSRRLCGKTYVHTVARFAFCSLVLCAASGSYGIPMPVG